MRKILRKRSFALIVAGLLVFAGLGAATHALDHGGQSVDAVCSFCVSSAHGKAPPPALVLESVPALLAIGELTASSLPTSSRAAHVPPARAPPLEAIV
ncbi:MAG: hypothetical protein H0W33_12985 [Gammaproteobacteria bacterium]|nr:hypothetical protein [Gammaproteobacteria bacterium]